eukprot:CAMPEP_0201620806 /NCGR_PEP_ID=MMETSP0492-20130828/45074_1 /ASSEMBLY_ACC=CAM_ASM_000837 /TAXON_ID=420259 /ORGANISM="Thalassiosira gravida, Strain GMp14c1" /LENGTH=399 /DNA_ID=CAMNT_0048090113 /DNA_START=231 /DNA_END=1427 /DNA_ORIENTATION=+
MSEDPGVGPSRGPPTPNVNMGMGSMGSMGGASMGYHGYQLPPGFAFPPHPQAMPPPGVGGGAPMISHPPDSYASHGNMVPSSEKNGSRHMCTVHPPGMPRAFDVPFPERRLPVCDRCKKNFKSRDLCRKRDGHKALPWQTTYIAVTITDGVLEKREDGEYIYIDVPVTAELQETPLMCLGPADGSMKLEPICKVCREKNYTRDYCRNTCKHTTPPWSTTYVKLVVDKTPKDEKSKYPKKRKKNQEENADGRPKPDPNQPENDDGKDVSDNLEIIHKSKTFLVAFSSKKMIVRWCERIQYPVAMDPDEAVDNAHAPSVGSAATPYSMNVASNPNVQNQNSQLWDAFRAGAIWAQSQGGQIPAGYGYGGMPNPAMGNPGAFFSQPPAPVGGGVPLPMGGGY